MNKEIKFIITTLSFFVSLTILSQTNNINSYFFEAIKKNKYMEASYWLEMGASINAVDSSGMAPIHYAAASDNPEMISWLIERKANVNLIDRNNFSALCYAIFNERYMKHVIDESEFTFPSSFNFNSLLLAIIEGGSYIKGGFKSCEVLLKSGADPNLKEVFIMPLSLASNKGDLRVCKLLIDYGADVTHKDEAGQVALDYCRNGRIATLLLNPLMYSNDPTYYELLEKVEISIRNNDFQNADKLCIESYEKAVVELEEGHRDIIYIANLLSKIKERKIEYSDANKYFSEYINNELLKNNQIKDYVKYIYEIQDLPEYKIKLVNSQIKLLREQNDWINLEPILELKLDFKKRLEEIDFDYIETSGLLCHIYNLNENYEKSEERYNELFAISERIKYPKYLFLLGYCDFLFGIGNYERAKLLSEELMLTNASDSQTNLYLKLIGTSNLSKYYFLNHNNDSAYYFADENVFYANQIVGEHRNEYLLTSKLNKANLLRQTKNIKEAIAQFEDAYNYLNDNGLFSLNIFKWTTYNLALSNFLIGDYSKSIFYLEKSNIIRRYIAQHDIDLNILGARVFEKQNRINESILLTNQALNSFIKISFDIFYSFSEKERESFWKTKTIKNSEVNNLFYMYSKYGKRIISTSAFDYSLFSKGLLLNTSNHIYNLIINSNDTTSINIFNELRILKKDLQIRYRHPILYQNEINTLEAQADSLDKILTKKSQKYIQSKDELNIKWQDVQKQLKRDEAAIEFVSFDYFNNYEVTDSILYYALVLKKNDSVPTFIPLFEERQLNDLLINSKDQYQLYASRASHTNFNRMQSTVDSTLYYGNKLYNLVWEPLESSLNGIKHIYYSPSGQLNNIAFAAIPTDKKVLLSDKYNLHQVTSTREVLNKSRNILKPKSIALFGGIEYELSDTLSQRNHLIDDGVSNKNKFSFDNSSESTSGFYKLDGTFDEVNSINDNFIKKGYQTYLFTESNASETNFKNLDVASADIIHIATHGFYFPVEKIKQNPSMLYMNKVSQRDIIVQNPLLRSGLILAGANKVWRGDSISINKEDGVLTAQEISQTNLTNTELVVLSACKTALGDINGSEGVFGLQRAFKMAGVKSLIVSLWKVPDKETSQMMQAFYYYWLNGMTKYDAFKKAQNEIRIIRPDPYYWAAFVLID